MLSGTLLSTSNEKLLVPLSPTANGQGPTLAAGPTLCDLPLNVFGISKMGQLCGSGFDTSVGQCLTAARRISHDPRTRRDHGATLDAPAKKY